MLKKTITYTDFNGKTRTEDFYFNLTKTELVRLDSDYPGGFEKYLQASVDDNQNGRIMDIFEDLIKRSYGIKSEDGKHFRKSVEISNEFFDTPAYDSLFIELCTNTDAATSFVTKLIPEDLRDQVNKELNSTKQA